MVCDKETERDRPNSFLFLYMAVYSFSCMLLSIDYANLVQFNNKVKYWNSIFIIVCNFITNQWHRSLNDPATYNILPKMALYYKLIIL